MSIAQNYVFKLNWSHSFICMRVSTGKKLNWSHSFICMHVFTGKDVNTKEIILHRNQSYEGVSNNIGSNNMNTVMQPCPAYGIYHW